MTKPFLKTLSLASVALAIAATTSAGEQNPRAYFVSTSAESIPSCSPQAEIDRGWEFQQELLEARLAARAPEGVTVPGAIIAPPFPSFAPYRTDDPSLPAGRPSARPANAQDRSSMSRSSGNNL